MKVIFSSITREELTDMAIWLKCGFLDYLKDEEVDNCKWIIKWASICDTLENAKYEKNEEIIL